LLCYPGAAHARGMAEDRSMPALLIDSEAGPGDERADRPLRLLRDADAGAPIVSGPPARPGGASRPKPTIVTGPLTARPASPVVPGIGSVHPAHVGGSVAAIVHPLATQIIQRPGTDPKIVEIARRAQIEPTRFGGDLLIRAHNPNRYVELARDNRLPSQVWAEHEGRGRLAEHLVGVHRQFGEVLERQHGHRPLGERALIGLAAGAGAHEDVVRALDALRARPTFPVRASFYRLVRGMPQADIARIGSTFLVPGYRPEQVVEEYRGVRERLEREHTGRRRELLRILRQRWAEGGTDLVPLFAQLTEGYSPDQVARVRLVLQEGADPTALFEAIEQQNMAVRLAADLAAFERNVVEWEQTHTGPVQSPLQEPESVLPQPTAVAAAEAAPAVPDEDPAPPEDPAAAAPGDEDAKPDSQRRLKLKRDGGSDGGGDEGEQPEAGDPGRGRRRRGQGGDRGLRLSTEPDDDLPSNLGRRRGRRVFGEAGDVGEVLLAPAPGAHAGDGVLPWAHLMQGLGPVAERELARAWAEGQPWETYRAILARRGKESRAAREREFLRRLEGLGCQVGGVCQIPRVQLRELADLGSHFAPEQWARLREALTEGIGDPLAVWRQIERENTAEAMSLRETAFLRHYGAAPDWRNTVEWSRYVPRMRRVVVGEAAGLFDDAVTGLEGALGGVAGGGAAPVVGDVRSMLGGIFGGAGGGSGVSPELVGTIGQFATQALGQLKGRVPSPRPMAPSAIPQAKDVAAALGAWGKNPIGTQWVQALDGIGLSSFATRHPQDVLGLIPGRLPQANTDPSTAWWEALSTGQGIPPGAKEALVAAVVKGGEQGTPEILAAYQQLLAPALYAQYQQREAAFKAILAAAQRRAGAAFDPKALPGGDPFRLLMIRAGGARGLEAALKSGQSPLDAFRKIEQQRMERTLQDAGGRMATLLQAAWQRQAEGWTPEQAPAAPAGEAGAIFERAYARPRPLYHISFNRPMPQREFNRLMEVVPSLRVHPTHVLQELAGLRGQARSVLGVDATTNEYVRRGHETPGDIAEQLVGDRRRARELVAANPAVGPEDVRYAIPPRWFGTVPYAVPVRRRDGRAGQIAAAVIGGPIVAAGELLARAFRPRGQVPEGRREVFGHEVERGRGVERGEIERGRAIERREIERGRAIERRETRGLDEDAGAMRGGGGGGHGGGGHGGGRARGRRGPLWGGGSSWAVPGEAEPLEDRVYEVTEEDARGPQSSTHTRDVAKRIAEVFTATNRPDAWAELRDANPDKPLDGNGFWRHVEAGEIVGIPSDWPEVEDEAGEVVGMLLGGAADWLEKHNPFGSPPPPPTATSAAPPEEEPLVDPPQPFTPPDPEYPGSWVHQNPMDLEGGRRANTGQRPTNLARRTYTVKQGDWPARIAQRYGATGRPRWLTELEQVNPHKPVDSGMGNFSTLNAGEEINIPNAWGTATEASGAEAGALFYPRRFPHGVVAARANLQAGPDDATARIGSLPAGTRVRIVEKGTGRGGGYFRDWARVEFNGGTGWIWMDVIARGEAAGVDDEAGGYDSGAVDDRENHTTHTYPVKKGDTLFKIAQKFVNPSNRPHWLAELRDANPTRRVDTRVTVPNPVDGHPDNVDPNPNLGTFSIHPGDVINVPDGWSPAESPHARKAPGTEVSPAGHHGLDSAPEIHLDPNGPPAKPSPIAKPGTTPAGALVDPGTIHRAQGYLASWGQANPSAAAHKDFGMHMPLSEDTLGVATRRMKEQVASFQKWSNRQPGAKKLRTDGVLLDPDTITALDSWHAQTLGGMTELPPATPIQGAKATPWFDPAPPIDVRDVPNVIIREFPEGPVPVAHDPFGGVYGGGPTPPTAPPTPAPSPEKLTEVKKIHDEIVVLAPPGVPALPPGSPISPMQRGQSGPLRPARPEKKDEDGGILLPAIGVALSVASGLAGAVLKVFGI